MLESYDSTIALRSNGKEAQARATRYSLLATILLKLVDSCLIVSKFTQ